MEKRKQKRKTMSFSVDYKSKKIFQFEQGRNISISGIFLETSEIEDVGTKIDLVITFPGEGDNAILSGEVVWNRKEEIKDENGNLMPKGMGIKFLKTSRYIKKKLKD